jgi:hypothetical protein
MNTLFTCHSCREYKYETRLISHLTGPTYELLSPRQGQVFFSLYFYAQLCPAAPVHWVIIIGSTALRGPWPSSEASASKSIWLLLLQIRDESFPGWGFQPHAQPPAILEDRVFCQDCLP